MPYYYISTKWTHKTDAYLTLWRGNSSGYCWNQSWAGIYDQPPNVTPDYGVIAVECEKVNHLFEATSYFNNPQLILPNSKEVRRTIGIMRKDLLRTYRSNCPSFGDIKKYRLTNEATPQ